ncbi:Histone-lysine N-methyltransferase SETMAR [Eumeta japonica]|uniref:Histone-lysine N-methyltransferase SETMAR n=1 Tax=Eumeta variegata TaxID=151549 RepID=A0A4C1V4V8_EUMVA|nr:Histone-lysine N-methyltransferase SETMAR [Eumeta japonica]
MVAKTVTAHRILLHHDNTSPYTGRQTTSSLGGVGILAHAPHSPDLAPCDLYSFLRIKEKLRGTWFTDAEEAVDPYEEAVDTSPKCEWAK